MKNEKISVCRKCKFFSVIKCKYVKTILKTENAKRANYLFSALPKFECEKYLPAE